ncbi:hypothetical protein [Paenibacillus hexagrammi]|uniref:Butirosin biosynthesis protein H N-terminal domain-containing protein n=1 Tax=Paenibacillus hexagrammi TaxID=2908839 RepID=A0ABY3SD32_9BACL|nr:hypothetical protein [Paenibacillus sp. YPD9-1]UJF31868.1 hypothetical protein L0M14_19180 [Paenibacillus sp. YPD9-1]
MSTRLSSQNEHNVNLGFMECFTSCVMTYVRVMGWDHRNLLLNYWNLDYQHQTLLGSKDSRKFSMDYLYGVDMNYVAGDLASLTGHIRQGYSVILLCMASRLDYFPRALLSMESSGFQHSILILGLDAESGFHVLDPIVNFSGFTTTAVVANAGATGRSETLHYFTLSEKKVDSLPSSQEILAFCSRRNLEFYEHPSQSVKIPGGGNQEERKQAWIEWFSNRRGGTQSFRLFIADLMASLEWPEQKRSSWGKRNSMTLSSIRQLRRQVWNTYREFMQLDQAAAEEGDQQISHIMNLWQRFHYLLLRLLSAGDKPRTAELICRKVEELEQAEIRFLSWLNQKVMMGHG